MYFIRDSYVGRAFTWTPLWILWGLFLFVAANLYGQMLFGLGCALSVWIGLSDYYWGIYFFFVPFALAMLSGVGIIFILADVWLLYELLYEEGVSSRFFFWVTVNQIGICACASIPVGEFLVSLVAAVVALVLLKLVASTLSWISWKILG